MNHNISGGIGFIKNLFIKILVIIRAKKEIWEALHDWHSLEHQDMSGCWVKEDVRWSL